MADEFALQVSRGLSRLFKAHPWHGITVGPDAPEIVNVYVEMVPTDTVKYEVEKVTGHLKVDRPQLYSSQSPTLYGFIPQTYCGASVGAFCESATGRAGIAGDGDPLDICVLTEKPIQHGDILLRAVPIGGLRMIDGNQADDKIIAVLNDDAVYGKWKDIDDCPGKLVDRLRHYFLTYKDIPGEESRRVEITDVFDAGVARQIVELSRKDYQESFGVFYRG